MKERLKHILWIGGATDSGKSTVAQKLADRHKLSVFHYDKEDDKQVERLSQTVPEFQKFLASSMEDRWVNTTPKEMFDFLLLTFPHRFALVVENLLLQPQGRPIIVEGFGLLPELVQPVLSSPYQAIWFVPTEEFKWESMTRRGKPSFASTLSDPDKARMNVFTRDTLLANYYRKEILSS
ncbi:MAG: cytidylate kinase-like family protein, partial [Anaerolineaceae bacterium]|nr:cytidylate kinase-like family protein [Anaerolineaceae bacterium]